MSTAPFQPSWKELYAAALFERNTDKAPWLICEAERAIKHRAREVSAATGDHIQEAETLDDALYALHGLKSCLAHRSRWADAT